MKQQQINVDDFVVLRPNAEETKFHLVKVKSTKDGFKGALESARKGLRVDSCEFSAKQVLLNLGPKPEPGKVYGLDLVNRFRRCIRHDFWGDILVFTNLDQATMTLVKKSLDRTAIKIDKLGLSRYVDFVDTHLVAKQGKWAGRYCHNAQKDEKDAPPSIIKYAPEYADLKPEAMDYVVYHEFAHVVRYNGVLGKKRRLQWLNEYSRSIDPFEIEAAQLKVLFKHLSSYIDGENTLGGTLREFMNEDEDHKLWVRGLLRWMKEVHHLTIKELNIIWENADIKALQDIWPSGVVDSSKLAPVVSEYATTNVEELFAEAMSFYCVKRKLPARIEDLVERSIRDAKVASKED